MVFGYVHDIDPVLADVGGVYLWWYGLGFALGFFQIHRFLVRGRLGLGMSARDASTLSILLMVVIGGTALKSGTDLLRQELGARRRHWMMIRSGDAPAVMSWVYLRMTGLFSRYGWPRRPSVTPHEYLAGLRAHLTGPLAPALAITETITDRFIAARYGRGDVSATEMDDARASLAELERLLRAHGRRAKGQA